jgi:hypothetical protein
MSGTYPTRDQLAAWTGAKAQADAPAASGCCGPDSAAGSSDKKSSCC